MFRFAMQHGGISPTGNTLLRQTVAQAGLRLSRRWPHRAMHEDDILVFEIAHLHGSVMPVAMDQTMLSAQQIFSTAWYCSSVS